MGKVHNRFLNEADWLAARSGQFDLGLGEVHLYRINISSNLKQLPAFAATLSPSETERGNKYFQLKDRQRFMISRGAQRNILGRYLSVSPTELQFKLGDNKKPYLVDEGGLTIQYNLSHSGDWILLAVSNAAVGADVELADPAFQFRDILEEHFSAEEITFINQQNSTERFFLLWTRKEALLKATGQGLGEHLKITPSLDGEHALPDTLLDAATDWQINSFNLSGNYKASIAAENINQSLRFFDIDF